jgi:hypothetical protein
MIGNFFAKAPKKFRKWIRFYLFLSLAGVFLMLFSTLLFKESSADILLIFIIWCLPLFIH